MELTVPTRSVADTQSFPVDPEGVSQWLARLRPLESGSDAREIHRGLKHSNRLHNDVDRRRAVLARFIPVLRELHDHLMDTCCAQPLPLTREFQRSSMLADGLLREEATAFKVLLSDSDQPAADDVRRAMQALARQAETAVHGYRTVPKGLLLDAMQLYELAERSNILGDSNPDVPGTEHHFRFILLLSLADANQQRVRQLPLVLLFLRDHLDALDIQPVAPNRAPKETDLVLHLGYGARPVPANSVHVPDDADRSKLRWLDLQPLLSRIDAHLARQRSTHTSPLGADTLERQSMARLRVALCRGRTRRSSRGIRHLPRQLVFGHKAICAELRYAAATRNDPDVPTKRNDEVDDATPPVADREPWILHNDCTQGLCLSNADCRPGEVEVGDLVSITDPDQPVPRNTGAKSRTLLGVVRWVQCDGQSAVRIGVECLARGVLPVSITPINAEQPVSSDGLIIACKVHKNVMQTLLLPAHTHQAGDRLLASLDGRTRRMQLKQCLQTNGLFSHFSLADT